MTIKLSNLLNTVTRIAVAIPIFLSISCSKDVDTPSTEKPTVEGAPAGIVMGSDQVDCSGNSLTSTIDILLIDEEGNPIYNLDESEIIFDTIDSTSESVVLHSIVAETSPLNTAYSVSLLMDQSGSIKITDPDDVRAEAASIFINFMGEDDEAMLSSFQGSGYEILNDFNSDSKVLLDNIEILKDTEEGETPLYFSIYELSQYLNDNANLSNRSIILFTDGDDSNRYEITPEDIIDQANLLDIKITTVGLGSNIDAATLSNIALSTGGAFMWAEDVKQLISMFANLGDLLHGDIQFYRLNVETNSYESWQQGYYSVNNILITRNGTVITVPYRVNYN